MLLEAGYGLLMVGFLLMPKEGFLMSIVGRVTHAFVFSKRPFGRLRVEVDASKCVLSFGFGYPQSMARFSRLNANGILASHGIPPPIARATSF